MNKSKPHLAIYPGPIAEHSDIESLCGEIVKCAQFGLVWDTAVMGQNWQFGINALQICRRCLTLALEVPESATAYVYVLVPRDSKVGRKLEALEESA